MASAADSPSRITRRRPSARPCSWELAQGGDGGAGANGGNGEGGGIYLAGGGSASLTNSIITLNAALDGDGKAGADGAGIGGGVYTLGTFTLDAATFINFNFASTSGDNIGP